MNVAEWVQLSEVVKNFAEVVAIICGASAFYEWIVQRRDRSTEVLFALEKQFTSGKIRRGRELIEDDEAYETIRSVLLSAALPPEIISQSAGAEKERHRKAHLEILAPLDDLLRFYIFLCGIRASRQVKDSALRACYRYWLAHYYSTERREFRLYVSRLFPTLTSWLEKDRCWRNRKFGRTFFGPEVFGWYAERRPTKQQLERTLRGRVLVLTGAGISAESDIPTYRGEEGYWRHYDPRRLATKTAFDADPQLVLEWYSERREKIKRSRPNYGHQAIARIGNFCKEFLLVT